VTRIRKLGRGTFSSLGIANYRLFFIGQLISASGTWMQVVGQSFLVLRLTNSGTVLGLTMAARFGPMFVLAPWGGAIADRFDRRRILYLTQIFSALLALTFGVLVATDTINIWQVYALAALLGVVTVFDNPARQAFISELVPVAQLRNAITLNSVSVNMARIFGAAVGGIVAATLGLALCFDLNAVSFLAVLSTLFLMATSQIAVPDRRHHEKDQIRAGLRYVRATPELFLPLMMLAVIGALAWEFQVSLPLLAKYVFHGGPATYGTMLSIMGAGAVVGGLVSASRSYSRMRGLSLAAVGWGVAITLAALAPSLPLEYVTLLAVGYGSITFSALAKTSLQIGSLQEMRGRVMALWALAWLGSTPIGGPIIGWIGQEFGARWSLLAGGIPTIAVGLLAYPVLRRIDLQKHLAASSLGAEGRIVVPDHLGGTYSDS
jgi:MFS family permease